MRRSSTSSFAGKRVLITGAARGIGAALARRLHERGAKVGLLGLEPELLGVLADECGGAPWVACDVGDRQAVEEAIGNVAGKLDGLDIVVANAGIAKQWSILHGDPAVLETTLRVNTLGTYHTVRSAAPYIGHPGGYVLLTASLGAAVNLPLLGAYSASKAAVEVLGNTARLELSPTGARVGVAYFAELDTDMTHRGFDTAAARTYFGPSGTRGRVAPLSCGIDAIERGISARARIICAPGWVRAVLPVRMLAQRLVDARLGGKRLAAALAVARDEEVPFTTPQPEDEA